MRHVLRTLRAVVVTALAAMPMRPSRVAAQSGLPTLRRIAVPGLDRIGPEKKGAAVAISSVGLVAFTGAFDSTNRAVMVIDTTGRVLARLGPPGGGPGELSRPLQLAFTATDVVTIEIAARRITRFGFDGSLRGVVTMPAPMILVGAAGDSLDMLQWPDGSAKRPVLDFVRVSPASATGRQLFSGQAPILGPLSEEGRQRGNTLASITYIADANSVVAANVGSHHFLGLEADGRMLFDVKGAPVSTPAGETPLYITGGLQRDGMQRIWALGTDRSTGRTFADLYLKGRYLGRLDLPCRGAAYVSGAFVALLCTEATATDRDVSLGVYRIHEGR